MGRRVGKRRGREGGEEEGGDFRKTRQVKNILQQ